MMRGTSGYGLNACAGFSVAAQSDEHNPESHPRAEHGHPVGPDLSGKTLVQSARESEPVPTSSRMNSLPQLSKSARSCGTGFIREDVGSAGETFGACPGLFANKFAPTTFEIGAIPLEPDLSGKTSAQSAGESKPVPASSRMNSLPQLRNRRVPVGPDLSGRASVQSAGESEPVPASSRMNSLLQLRNRRDPVGPDLSGKTSVQSAGQSEPVPASSRMNSLLQLRNRRDLVGPDLSGKTSVQSAR
jgi:hypothetical protein